MSIDRLGAAAGVTGIPLAQAKGDVERASAEIGAQRRRMHHARKAEAAAGIGEPDGEYHEIADRNGDGRRPWEAPPAVAADDPPSDAPQSRDLCKESGNLLDLSG
jgi:hypothetical protein